MARLSCNLIVCLVTLTVFLPATLCSAEETTQKNLKKLARANNELALNLLHQLTSGSSENIFFSPLSLSTAFGMLYYGTKGDTAQELRNVLGYERAELPESLVHGTFQKYLTESLPSQDASAYVLNLANSILLDDDLDVESLYKTGVENFYQASVQDVDFATQGEKVVQDVNSWVKENTNGKIDKLIDNLDSSTILVILNAIYFKGSWKTQFEPRNTRPQTFYNNGLESNTKQVDMMKLTEEFRCSFMPDAQVIELPYKGENISMVIIIPSELDGLEDIERGLTLKKLKTIRRGMRKTKVDLMLPKFKIEYSKEMSSDFQSLGLESIFSPGADFSGMTSSQDVFVSEVFHKAVVEVNEEGSEAVAVTMLATARNTFNLQLVADHPFLFVIMDKRNDMIIFIGRVTSL